MRQGNVTRWGQDQCFTISYSLGEKELAQCLYSAGMLKY